MNNTILETKKIKKEIDKLKNAGNLQKAIETCQIAISRDSNNTELHVKLGDLYMDWHLDISQMKQCVDEAITEYQLALESNVDNAELYYKLGVAFYYKRELDKALSYFKLALEHNDKFAQSYYMMAEVCMKKGEFAEAKEYSEKAIKKAPYSSSRAYFLLYNLYKFSSKKKKKWRKMYINLIDSFLTLPFDKYAQKEVMRRLTYFELIPYFIKTSILISLKGFTSEVLDLYKEIVDKAPGCPELYVNLGRIYYELGRYDEAICEYNMAIWLDSLNLKAYYQLCNVYEEQGDYERAISTCKKLIEIQPHVVEFHCKLAGYLYLNNEVSEAIEHYQTAITLNYNPITTSVVAQTLGFLFQENNNDLDAAISAYQTANLLNPADIDIYLNLGNVFFEKSSYDNALVVYKKALDLYPHNAKLHCNLGYLYWGKGDIPQAIIEYEKAIKYNSSYDIAYNNLGVIYLDDLGKIKEAIELFEEARACNPNYALANYNLARSIAIKGDKIEAAKLYRMALDINKYTNEMDPEEIEEKIQDLFT